MEKEESINYKEVEHFKKAFDTMLKNSIVFKDGTLFYNTSHMPTLEMLALYTGLRQAEVREMIEEHDLEGYVEKMENIKKGIYFQLSKDNGGTLQTYLANELNMSKDTKKINPMTIAIVKDVKSEFIFERLVERLNAGKKITKHTIKDLRTQVRLEYKKDTDEIEKKQ